MNPEPERITKDRKREQDKERELEKTNGDVKQNGASD